MAAHWARAKATIRLLSQSASANYFSSASHSVPPPFSFPPQLRYPGIRQLPGGSVPLLGKPEIEVPGRHLVQSRWKASSSQSASDAKQVRTRSEPDRTLLQPFQLRCIQACTIYKFVSTLDLAPIVAGVQSRGGVLPGWPERAQGPQVCGERGAGAGLERLVARAGARVHPHPRQGWREFWYKFSPIMITSVEILVLKAM